MKFSINPDVLTYPSTIQYVSFYCLGSDENADDSAVSVTNKELFKGVQPVPDGVYDAHMGTTDHSWRCQTCGLERSLAFTAISRPRTSA